MSNYLLGIDAGGTKTQGILRALDSKETWSYKSGQGSLSIDFSSASINIKEVAEQLLTQGKCAAEETIVVCGAAGACNESLKLALEKTLQALNFQKLVITTDAQLSLYGAGEGAAIIVLALGTGSVAMRLDKFGIEKQFGGWGFVAGDQGGGAYIGRELVAAILREFDRDDFQPDEFITAVLKIIGTDKQAILNWLKNATATQFASLSSLVSDANSTSQLAQTILQQAALEVEHLIHSAQGKHQLPICMIGGLAKVITPLLSAQIQALIIPAKGEAVDGAIYLAEQLI